VVVVVCFATDDIEAEIRKMREHGFEARNEILDFHSRKLVSRRSRGAVVELSQWHEAHERG
jgi:hypothetical protein